MSTNSYRHNDISDKENSIIGSATCRKDKSTEESISKKTALRESSHQMSDLLEPTSPQDTKLLQNKREMQYK